MTSRFTVNGMHCLSCKKLIEEVCQEIPGVSSCSVDFEDRSAVVEHDESVTVPDLNKKVAELGNYKFSEI